MQRWAARTKRCVQVSGCRVRYACSDALGGVECVVNWAAGLGAQASTCTGANSGVWATQFAAH